MRSGGVHFLIDSEFERTFASAIAGLQAGRYAGARAEFDKVGLALDHIPPDGKGAIRAVFHAAEALFCLMFPTETLLGGTTSERLLRAIVDKHLSGDDAAHAAAHHVVASFKDWVLAAHNYRHAQGTPEPSDPPLSLALLMISEGAGFIRWLAELDAEEQRRDASTA
jgi:hypothetical protein